MTPQEYLEQTNPGASSQLKSSMPETYKWVIKAMEGFKAEMPKEK